MCPSHKCISPTLGGIDRIPLKYFMIFLKSNKYVFMIPIFYRDEYEQSEEQLFQKHPIQELMDLVEGRSQHGTLEPS